MSIPSLPAQWPLGDGETAGLVRQLGTADSPLGGPAQWPAALRAAIDLLLPSQAQIVLCLLYTSPSPRDS